MKLDIILTPQNIFKIITNLPLEEQHAVLNQTIEDWRGPLDQVDDILIIGVRI